MGSVECIQCVQYESCISISAAELIQIRVELSIPVCGTEQPQQGVPTAMVRPKGSVRLAVLKAS